MNPVYGMRTAIGSLQVCTVPARCYYGDIGNQGGMPRAKKRRNTKGKARKTSFSSRLGRFFFIVVGLALVYDAYVLITQLDLAP